MIYHCVWRIEAQKNWFDRTTTTATIMTEKNSINFEIVRQKTAEWRKNILFAIEKHRSTEHIGNEKRTRK